MRGICSGFVELCHRTNELQRMWGKLLTPLGDTLHNLRLRRERRGTMVPGPTRQRPEPRARSSSWFRVAGADLGHGCCGAHPKSMGKKKIAPVRWVPRVILTKKTMADCSGVRLVRGPYVRERKRRSWAGSWNSAQRNRSVASSSLFFFSLFFFLESKFDYEFEFFFSISNKMHNQNPA